MKEENAAFARMIYQAIVDAMEGKPALYSLDRIAWLGAAQACLECGWGKAPSFLHANNPFGIKPVQGQPFMGSEYGNVRVFRDIAEACRSWAYLVFASSLYIPARILLLHALQNGAEYKPEREIYLEWFKEFCHRYNTEDPHYWDKISALAVEVEPLFFVPIAGHETTEKEK
ncbi:MAG: glucosaminidase domain-containing protein [bacterium]